MKERRSEVRLEADKILLNLEKKSDEEIREVLDELYKEERKVSYRRRMLHGKIDIIRQELIHRLSNKHKEGKSLFDKKDISKLTEILTKTLAGDNPGSK